MFRVDESLISIKTHNNNVYPCQFQQVTEGVPQGYRLYKNSLAKGIPIFLLQAEEKHMSAEQQDLSNLKLTHNCKLIIDMQIDHGDQLLLPSSGIAPYFVGDHPSTIRACRLFVKSKGALVKVGCSGVFPPDSLTEVAQKKRRVEDGVISHSVLPPAESQFDTDAKRRQVDKKPVADKPKTVPPATIPAAAASSSSSHPLPKAPASITPTKPAHLPPKIEIKAPAPNTKPKLVPQPPKKEIKTSVPATIPKPVLQSPKTDIKALASTTKPKPVPQPPKEATKAPAPITNSKSVSLLSKEEIKAPMKDTKMKLAPQPPKASAPKTPSLEIKKAGPDIRKLKNEEQRKLGTAALKKYLDLVKDEKAMEMEDKKRFGKALKKHQNLSLVEILQAREKQAQVEGVFEKPTGSGKTIIMISSGQITREKNVIISPANEIGQQTMDEVNAINSRLPKNEKLIAIDVLKEINEQQINDETKSNDEKRRLLREIFCKADFLTFTYQYLRGPSSLAELMPWDLVSVVNLDEAHECCSAKSKQFIDMFRKHGCHIHAYTASPYLFKSSTRVKKGGANDVYQLLNLTPETNPFSKFDIRDSIDEGINCPLKIFHITVKEEKGEELTITPGKGNDFNDEKISSVINKDKFNLIVADQYANGTDPVSQFPFRGQQFIVFCVDVKHCNDITAQINAMLPIDKIDPTGQLRAAYAKRKVDYYKKNFPDQDISENQAKKEFMVIGAYHSKMSKKECTDMYLKIKLGGVLLVANVDKLVRGCDFPRLAGVFALRPTQAETIKKQGPGRGLRLDPENPIKICYLFEFIWGETECIYYFQFLTKDGVPQSQWGDNRIEAFRKLQQPSQFDPIPIAGVADYKRHDDLKYENKTVIIGGKPVRYKAFKAVKTKKEKSLDVKLEKVINLPTDTKEALKTLIDYVNAVDQDFAKFKREITIVFEADEQMDVSDSTSESKPRSGKDAKDEIKTPPVEVDTKSINDLLDNVEKKLSVISSYIAPPTTRGAHSKPKKVKEKQNGKDEKIESLHKRLARLEKESKNLKEKIKNLYLKAHMPEADAMVIDELNEVGEEKILQNEIQPVVAKPDAVKETIQTAPESTQKEAKKEVKKEAKKESKKEPKKEKLSKDTIVKAQEIIKFFDAQGKDINIYHLADLEYPEELKTRVHIGVIAKVLLLDKNKRDKLKQWRLNGGSILHYLADFKSDSDAFFTIVDAILDNEELQLDVNLQDENGNTPLHILAKSPIILRKNREKKAYFLLKLVEKGANLNISNADNYTPAHVAIAKENDLLVSLLVGSGAELNQKTALTKLKLSTNRQEFLKKNKLYIDALSSIQTPPVHEIKGQFDRTLLHEMISFDRLDMFETVLSWFENATNVKDSDERTPLHHVFAASMLTKHWSRGDIIYKILDKNILKVLTALIKSGADVNVFDKFKSTPLHYAFNDLVSYLDAALYLLPYLKDELINSQDEKRRTLLHLFFQNAFHAFCRTPKKKPEIAKLETCKKNVHSLFNTLMERKAYPNSVDEKGFKPLDYALQHLSAITIDPALQLAKSTDLSTETKKAWVNSEGNSRLHLLCYHKHVDATKLIALASLVGSEAQLNLLNKNKVTPLHLLMRTYIPSLLPLVKHLFSMKLNLNYAPGSSTPLHEFCDRRDADFTAETEELLTLFTRQNSLFLQPDQQGRIAFEIAATRLTESSFRIVECLLHFTLKAANGPVLNKKGQNALHLFILTYKGDSTYTYTEKLWVRMTELIRNYYLTQFRIDPFCQADHEGKTPLYLLFNDLNDFNKHLAIKIINEINPAAVADPALFQALFKPNSRLSVDSQYQLFKLLKDKAPTALLKANSAGMSGLTCAIQFLLDVANGLRTQNIQNKMSFEQLLRFKQELRSYEASSREASNRALFYNLNVAIALINTQQEPAQPVKEADREVIEIDCDSKPADELEEADMEVERDSDPETSEKSEMLSTPPGSLVSLPSISFAPAKTQKQVPMSAPPSSGQPSGLLGRGFFAPASSSSSASSSSPFQFSMSAPMAVSQQFGSSSAPMNVDQIHPFASPAASSHTPSFFSSHSSSSHSHSQFKRDAKSDSMPPKGKLDF